ncbi:hypothetical protein A6A07_31260 [Streptomyces sp. CB03911]|nr:hypothetical protein A6A07_31260 [Streptomyces sp. CB03911]
MGRIPPESTRVSAWSSVRSGDDENGGVDEDGRSAAVRQAEFDAGIAGELDEVSGGWQPCPGTSSF